MRDFWVSAILRKTELLEDPGRDFPSNKNANLDHFFYVGSAGISSNPRTESKSVHNSVRNVDI